MRLVDALERAARWQRSMRSKAASAARQRRRAAKRLADARAWNAAESKRLRLPYSDGD